MGTGLPNPGLQKGDAQRLVKITCLDGQSYVVLPSSIYFGQSYDEYQPTWLMTALDVGRGASLTFALKNICSWKPAGISV